MDQSQQKARPTTFVAIKDFDNLNHKGIALFMAERDLGLFSSALSGVEPVWAETAAPPEAPHWIYDVLNHVNKGEYVSAATSLVKSRGMFQEDADIVVDILNCKDVLPEDMSEYIYNTLSSFAATGNVFWPKFKKVGPSPEPIRPIQSAWVVSYLDLSTSLPRSLLRQTKVAAEDMVQSLMGLGHLSVQPPVRIVY